jgi:hypothetical protein
MVAGSYKGIAAVIATACDDGYPLSPGSCPDLAGQGCAGILHDWRGSRPKYL